MQNFEVKDLPLSEITEDPGQPRQEIDPERVAALAKSITTHGLMQPIMVRKSPYGSGYFIIAGHRRYRAFVQLCRETIPAIISDVESESKTRELSLIENLQRDDLNAWEIAESFFKLAELGMIQRAIAELAGYSESLVSQYLKTYKAVEGSKVRIEKMKKKGIRWAYETYVLNKDKEGTRAGEKEKNGNISIKIKDLNNVEEVENAILKLEEHIGFLKSKMGKAS
ncbi:MAG TPA: ParB/RepB/Spo0J family partition protein [bacterium]|nr:ParB/RepB/Spo0J family partition protein [bacterium]